MSNSVFFVGTFLHGQIRQFLMEFVSDVDDNAALLVSARSRSTNEGNDDDDDIFHLHSVTDYKSSDVDISRQKNFLFSVKRNDTERFQNELYEIRPSHNENSLKLRIETMENNDDGEGIPVYKAIREVDSTFPEEVDDAMNGTVSEANASTVSSDFVNPNLPGQIEIPTAGHSVGTSITTHEVFSDTGVELTNGPQGHRRWYGEEQSDLQEPLLIDDHGHHGDDDEVNPSTSQGQGEGDSNEGHRRFASFFSALNGLWAMTVQSIFPPRWSRFILSFQVAVLICLVVVSIGMILVVRGYSVYSTAGHSNNNHDTTPVPTFLESSFGPTLGPSPRPSTTTVPDTNEPTAIGSSNSPTSVSTDERKSLVFACARKLSRVDIDDDGDDSPQHIASNWFIDGGGAFIDVPSSDMSCLWDTAFGLFYALIVIRESLHILDASWYRNTYENPIRLIQQVCHWARIVCDPNTVNGDGGGGSSIGLSALILQDAGLKGTIPYELVGLGSQLGTLKIDNNPQVYGTIPSEIGTNFPNIQYFYLQMTGLTGTVPSSLGNLTSLQQFLIDRTSLTGTMPSEICNLRQQDLKELSADCRSVHGVACDFPACCTKCS